jgi:hypothetical protein
MLGGGDRGGGGACMGAAVGHAWGQRGMRVGGVTCVGACTCYPLCAASYSLPTYPLLSYLTFGFVVTM